MMKKRVNTKLGSNNRRRYATTTEEEGSDSNSGSNSPIWLGHDHHDDDSNQQQQEEEEDDDDDRGIGEEELKESSLPLILFTLLSFMTRWYKIGWADRPIWDEAHFGKFGSYYIRHYHHHDVHPPLAKMLIGLAGKLSGYDGHHDFTDGSHFPSEMRYDLMRMMISSFGVALVPLALLTVRALNLSKRCQYLTATLVLFDNGFISITKFLLLDPFLLCFSSMTVYFWAKFYNIRKRPFTKVWWYNLLMMGGSMGLNCSCKWGVPLFLVTTVGLYTIYELWTYLNQPHPNKLTYQFKHWMARIIGLILLPATIYLISFKFHFMILNNQGVNDYTMDSQFIARLNGTGLEDNRMDVAFGANITLRATILNGGLVHSHNYSYPEGSKEQQVTAQRKHDEGDYWIIKDPKDPDSNENDSESDPPTLLKDGSIIQLIHFQTGKFLSVQPDHFAPISKDKAYEVSASSLPSLNNQSQSHWQLIIYDDRQFKLPVDAIHTVTTRLKLLNPTHNCLLASADSHLPTSWGFHHLEVKCVRRHSDDYEVLFNFEFNQHPHLPIAPKDYLQPRFFYDLFRTHHAMWSTNVGLIPDPDQFDHLASVALDWPLLRRGIAMSSWEDEDIKFFMFGNPMVWWFTTLMIITFPLIYLTYLIRHRRHYRDWSPYQWQHFHFLSYLTLSNYLLHYLPFLFMTRVLYLHHYFPSLYYSTLISPYLLELSLPTLPSRTLDRLFLTLTLLIILSYLYFSPFTYGFNYPGMELSGRRWLESWDFVRKG